MVILSSGIGTDCFAICIALLTVINSLCSIRKVTLNHFVLVSGPAPTARDGAPTPAPDLQGGSLGTANLACATAGPVLPRANPSHAHALASPGLIRQNASPVRRAVPRWSQSAILAVDPRRMAESTSLAVGRRPQWRTGRKNGQPDLRPAHHPNRRMTAAPSRGTSDRPHAQSRDHDLVHGQDQLLRIRGWRKWRGVFFLSLLRSISVLYILSCFIFLAGFHPQAYVSLLTLKQLWVS